MAGADRWAHRLLRWASVPVIAASAVLAPTSAAYAAAEPVVDGYLDWGFKASFRQYLSTGDGNPPIAAGHGASINPDGTFRFPATGGNYDPATGAATVHHGGSVVFSYPAHQFTITLANPTVALEPGAARLLLDVTLETSGGMFEPVDVTQAEIASVSAAAPVVDGDLVRWNSLPTVLTALGAEVLAGFYPAGTDMDPLSMTVSLDGELGSGPVVTVTPGTGLDPDGATIQVSGAGFDPTSPGIYVAFGPAEGDWWSDPRAFPVAVWVHPGGVGGGGQDVLHPDGTFSTTLSVAATFPDHDLDCLATTCYVVTMRAHGSTDRSQDTRTPVSFAGGPPVGGGSAQQQLSVEVTGGPLILSVAGDQVGLSPVTVGGTATGDLHPAQVSDLRGTGVGWSLVGQAGDFTGSAGTIPADQLGWQPSASVVDGDGTVEPGAAIDGGLGEARTLCTGPAGGTGGVFQCGAQVSLSVPASAAPGSYLATLTLTLA